MNSPNWTLQPSKSYLTCLLNWLQAQATPCRRRRRTRKQRVLGLEELQERQLLSAIALVSLTSDGVQGNLHSREAAISGDGLYVAFDSESSNLVPGDTNASVDIFVQSRQSQAMERISLASDGAQGNHHSRAPAISYDGRYVAFQSQASNLLPNDTNGRSDVFLYDRLTDTIERISQSSDGVQGNGDSGAVAISADGRYVAFESSATNLVPGDNNQSSDAFVYDRQTGALRRVSTPTQDSDLGASHRPALSADGRYVAFESRAASLVPNDTNATWDIFVYDLQTEAIERVSVASDGSQGNGGSYLASLSADGRFVAFQSDGNNSNLVPGDNNGKADIFVYDRQLRAIEMLSVGSDGTPGSSDSFRPSISGDGRYVAFDSYAVNLVPGDTNTAFDVFVYDRGLDRIERASVAFDGRQGDGHSYSPSISADGRYIAFTSAATTLVADSNNKEDVMVARVGHLSARDIVAGTDAGGLPLVRVHDSVTGDLIDQIMPYHPGFTGGVRVAMGDLNGDGAPDIIAAAGPGGGPHVRVFDGVTREQLPGPLGSFFAYSATFSGGVYVAAGDVNDDGHDDIITGAGSGGGPHVRVFSGLDGRELNAFFAYAAGFTGGVRVAAGNVNDDGAADIMTAAGAGGGPHVKVISGSDGAELMSFFAYAPGFTGGVFVAAGDVNGDSRADIITGAGATGGPHVRVIDGQDGSERHSFFAYNAGFTGGVRVAASDLNGDNLADVITAAGPGGGPHVRGFSGQNLAEVFGVFAFSPSFTGGVYVAGSVSALPSESLHLAGQLAGAAGQIDQMTMDDLTAIAAVAIERWSQASLPEPLRLQLHQFRLDMDDFPGGLLGLAISDLS